MTKNKHVHESAGGGAYFLGFIGAVVYYIQQADSFWMGVLGVLKAIVWPAFAVYHLWGFNMFKDTHAFSGFSVDDLAKAKEFYAQTLGLEVEESPMGLTLHIAGTNGVFVYQKDNHVPAEFTILNFPVEDINKAIDELSIKGVLMERYDDMPAPLDEKGVLRGLKAGMGPDIAWFKDPAGNVLAILQDT